MLGHGSMHMHLDLNQHGSWARPTWSGKIQSYGAGQKQHGFINFGPRSPISSPNAARGTLYVVQMKHDVGLGGLRQCVYLGRGLGEKAVDITVCWAFAGLRGAEDSVSTAKNPLLQGHEQHSDKSDDETT